MMTTEKAIARLRRKLEAHPAAMEPFDSRAGGPVSPAQIAEDLVEWLNLVAPTAADVARLWSLVESGRFLSWECPTCGDRVYVGDPEDWGDFQGVCQADYASYPGFHIGSDDARCDSCRMWMKGPYIPDGYHLEPDR